MHIENSDNFRRVSDLMTTSGVVGAERLGSLASEGYKVVINLLPDNSKYAVKNERQLVEAQGVKYVYIPVDFKHPVPSDYDAFASALDEAKGQKVHIHCAANYRVSAFYALYAEARGVWSRAEAQTFVQALWQPQEAEGWPEFIAQIEARSAT